MAEHSHCPDGCEHPQPFSATPVEKLAVERAWPVGVELEFCGRCWHRFGELVVMVPCTPAVCVDAR